MSTLQRSAPRRTGMPGCAVPGDGAAERARVKHGRRRLDTALDDFARSPGAATRDAAEDALGRWCDAHAARGAVTPTGIHGIGIGVGATILAIFGAALWMAS